MEMTVLDGGRIHIHNWEIFQPGVGDNTERWIANSCYLIRHPQGLVLWDIGLPDSIHELPENLQTGHFASFLKETTLKDELAAVGVDPSEINYVVLSHLHSDHSGNLDLFTEAEIIIAETELAAALDSAESDHSHFDVITAQKIARRAHRRITDDLDLYGDGTITVLSMPGHTPGSLALLVHLPESGTILLSGDLAHSVENWDNATIPTLNWDHQHSIESLQRAKAIAAENNAAVWIQHDLDQHRKVTRNGITFR
jgi:N-acyl homoserine lactone hydrolase